MAAEDHLLPSVVLSSASAPQTPRKDKERESVWTNCASRADEHKFTNGKVLHFVRHAQGYHNVDKRPIQQQDADASLTKEGVEQCRRLQRAVAELQPDLIVSSPLTRTLQTASLVFEEQIAAGVQLIALEAFRETVNFRCDTRRDLSLIKPEFPQVAERLRCEHSVGKGSWKGFDAPCQR